MYGYPSGTCCYDVTGIAGNTNAVDVKNSYPYTGNDPATHGNDDQYACMQAVGMVVVYENSTPPVTPDEAHPIEYWIAEGNDITYTKYKWGRWIYGTTPENAITPVTFCDVKASVSPGLLKSATLTTVVASGDSRYNRLYFNDHTWDGLWNCNPYADFSWAQTDVTDCLVDGDNTVKIQNGLYDPIGGDRQMNAANAFLVIKYRGSEAAIDAVDHK